MENNNHTAISYSLPELTEEFDTSDRAILFYEGNRLISPRRKDPNYPVYSRCDRARLKLIVQAERFDYSVSDIVEMIGYAAINTDETQQIEDSIAYGEKKLKQLEGQVSDQTGLEQINTISNIKLLRQYISELKTVKSSIVKEYAENLRASNRERIEIILSQHSEKKEDRFKMGPEPRQTPPFPVYTKSPLQKSVKYFLLAALVLGAAVFFLFPNPHPDPLNIPTDSRSHLSEAPSAEAPAGDDLGPVEPGAIKQESNPSDTAATTDSPLSSSPKPAADARNETPPYVSSPGGQPVEQNSEPIGMMPAPDLPVVQQKSEAPERAPSAEQKPVPKNDEALPIAERSAQDKATEKSAAQSQKPAIEPVAKTDQPQEAVLKPNTGRASMETPVDTAKSGDLKPPARTAERPKSAETDPSQAAGLKADRETGIEIKTDTQPLVISPKSGAAEKKVVAEPVKTAPTKANVPEAGNQATAPAPKSETRESVSAAQSPSTPAAADENTAPPDLPEEPASASVVIAKSEPAPETPPQTVPLAEPSVEAKETEAAETPEPEVDINRTNDPKALQWSQESYENVIRKNFPEVIRTASLAISLDPGLVTPYINRALAYSEQGMYDQAIRDCRIALKINPQNALALNNRGLAYQRKGDSKNALSDYEKACSLGFEVACRNHKELSVADELARLLNQSQASFRRGDWNGVITAATRALELDSRNIVAYTNRSAAYAQKNLLKQALDDSNAAIRINPKFGLAYNNRGYALELLGETVEATIEYEKSCELGFELGCRNFSKLTSPR